jgi:hypothetical protein
VPDAAIQENLLGLQDVAGGPARSSWTTNGRGCVGQTGQVDKRPPAECRQADVRQVVNGAGRIRRALAALPYSPEEKILQS